MARRVNVYLTEEAVKNLSEIQEYLVGLTGCKISRSAAVNALLVRGAGLFLDDQRNVRRVVAKYVEGPLMQRAQTVVREEAEG